MTDLERALMTNSESQKEKKLLNLGYSEFGARYLVGLKRKFFQQNDGSYGHKQTCLNGVTSMCKMMRKKALSKKPKTQAKVEKTMSEFKAGELESGSGRPVTSRKQALAIALSQARRHSK